MNIAKFLLMKIKKGGHKSALILDLFAGLIIRAAENAQDIPEQKRDAGKQRKRCGDVLRRVIMMPNV